MYLIAGEPLRILPGSNVYVIFLEQKLKGVFEEDFSLTN